MSCSDIINPKHSYGTTNQKFYLQISLVVFTLTTTHDLVEMSVSWYVLRNVNIDKYRLNYPFSKLLLKYNIFFCACSSKKKEDS